MEEERNHSLKDARGPLLSHLTIAYNRLSRLKTIGNAAPGRASLAFVVLQCQGRGWKLSDMEYVKKRSFI
jgi:hypothetical protein